MKKQYLIFRRELQSVINQAAASAKCGKEIVGIIVDNGYYLELVMCKNKSRRDGSFSFFYKEVRSIVAAAKRLGHDALGTFHSHPAGLAEPGESDIANAPDDTLMLIVDCLARDAALWWINHNKARRLSLIEVATPNTIRS